MPKPALCAALGVLGGAVSAAFGGWDNSLAILVFLMGADYATGLVVAGVFHRSNKSESGTLESRAGLKGLLRKAAMLTVVCVANAVDVLMGTAFIRDAVVIGFAANEGLSILENAALMGVPIPNALLKSLDAMKKHHDENGNQTAAGAAVQSRDKESD